MRTHGEDVVAALARAGVEVSVHLMSDTALIGVAASTDPRLSKLRALRWSDVDFGLRLVPVRPTTRATSRARRSLTATGSCG
jgi:integrase